MYPKFCDRIGRFHELTRMSRAIIDSATPKRVKFNTHRLSRAYCYIYAFSSILFESRTAPHFLLRARMGLNVAFGRVRFCEEFLPFTCIHDTWKSRNFTISKINNIVLQSVERFLLYLSYIFLHFYYHFYYRFFFHYQKNLLQIKLEWILMHK